MFHIQDVKSFVDILIGKKLQYICRSCDMIDIGFGDLHKKKDNKNKERIVTAYSLHLFCPFRITDTTGVILGSQDLFISSESNESVVDLGVKNSTLFDIKLEDVKEQLKNEYVKDINVNEYGDISIALFNHTISIFVDGATDFESWRFLKPNVNKPHLIKIGNKFEFS